MPIDDLVRDSLLAYAHYISIFAFASVMVAEFVLVRKNMQREFVSLISIVDRWYGAFTVLVLVTGLLRLVLGAKGREFYLHNLAFWTKMCLFVILRLLSVTPFIRWAGRVAPDGSLELADTELRRLRSLLFAQIVVFVLIPLCAALMARGL